MTTTKLLFLIGALILYQSEASVYSNLPSVSDLINAVGRVPQRLGISGNLTEALFDQETVNDVVSKLTDVANSNIQLGKDKLIDLTRYLGDVTKSKINNAKKSVDDFTHYLTNAASNYIGKR